MRVYGDGAALHARSASDSYPRDLGDRVLPVPLHDTFHGAFGLVFLAGFILPSKKKGPVPEAKVHPFFGLRSSHEVDEPRDAAPTGASSATTSTRPRLTCSQSQPSVG